ncbi:DUF3192 domain-containing protein [Glaciecola siphonariae]|uniref:DUF3192 domain-containing protein n=1 Tax=Glaciecola siphonariae TaxID=521012 RepID=A0ABV9LV65_9ALTE
MRAIIPLLVAASLGLSGCVISIDDGDYDGEYSSHSSWKKEQASNKRDINELSLGQTKDSVVSKMGAPAFNEALQKEGHAYQLLWYRTHHRESDGITSKDECTPLIFKNAELIGWGETALQKL